MQLQWNTPQTIAPARRPLAWRGLLVAWFANCFGRFVWYKDASAEMPLDEPPMINERPYPSRDTVSSIGLFARSRMLG